LSNAAGSVAAVAERFYDPVKVGSKCDFVSSWDDEDDDDDIEWSDRDLYAVRPRDRSGRTLGSELKLGRQRADMLCDLLEEVRQFSLSQQAKAA
jgi:hypothetical protein